MCYPFGVVGAWGLPMAMKFTCMLLGSHFSFLCVDLKLEMYDIGVPRGCMLMLYLQCRVKFGVVGIGGGGNVWYW